MSVERYFKENEKRLEEIYEIFRNTDYCKKLNLPDWDFQNYDKFKNLPFLDPRKADFKQLFVPGKNLWCFITSGVSGNKKSVYRDIGTIVGYPKEMDEALRANRVVFLHSKRRKGESYYETHDFNHKRMYPHAFFVEYKSREELLKYVQKGDVLFIVEYPLMAEWISYQLERALKSKLLSENNIVKKKVYLELSGEPVTKNQVNNIVKRLEKVFRTEVEYFITYGSNEIGHIGTYVPALHGSEIIYEVNPSLFVEVIENEIVITPYRKQGTILFRYKTGDKGELFFKEDGKPFLKVFGKRKEDGIVYVAGAQVNISRLVSKIGKMVIDSLIGVECIKKENAVKGICKLTIKVHTFKFLDNSLRERVTHMIKRFIIGSAILSVENHLGMLKIDVQYSIEPIKKRWFISDDTK